ncbi:hypothetical protein UlMin_000523 [Ulmus minor]
MIFIYVISQKVTNRMAMEDWQHSGSTISIVFTRICKAIASLSPIFIKPPNFDDVPDEIRFNPKYYPYFQDCIGAIDGTHIAAHAPSNVANNYRGRKSNVTTNMLAVCSFDMLFTYVVTGWEGAVHDSRVLTTQLEDPNLGFPHPPPGGRINGPTELFNYRHASLRNCIERCFGFLSFQKPELEDRKPETVPNGPYISQYFSDSRFSHNQSSHIQIFTADHHISM